MNNRPISPFLSYRFNEQTVVFTDVVIWTPSNGKSVKIYGLVLSTNNKCMITLKFGTGPSAKTLLKLYLAANSSQVVSFYAPIQGLTNEVVSWSNTSASNVALTLFGQEVQSYN